MPRRPMSEEQKAILRERLAKARAAKQARENKNPLGESATPAFQPDPQNTTSAEPNPWADPLPDEYFANFELPPDMPTVPPNPSPADYAELLKRIQELEQRQWQPQQPSATTGPQAGPQGLVGTYEKYTLTPKYYPDPRMRLSKEPRLQRFAFPLNYELGWNVSVSAYKTADGINTREPKFTIELYRIIVDENTGEPTTGRYTICRGIFHEDPDAALVVARDNGYEVEEWAEKEFLDEMRYLRIRDWLMEAFYPPKQDDKRSKREMVIDGKLVEYFEINSERSQSVPFSQLKSKL